MKGEPDKAVLVESTTETEAPPMGDPLSPPRTTTVISLDADERGEAHASAEEPLSAAELLPDVDPPPEAAPLSDAELSAEVDDTAEQAQRASRKTAMKPDRAVRNGVVKKTPRS